MEMSTALLAVFAVILCILFRILNVHSSPQKPVLICQDQAFLSTILKIAPVIAEPIRMKKILARLNKMTVPMEFVDQNIQGNKQVIKSTTTTDNGKDFLLTYKPTRLWGFSGHVQTIVHSIIGRVRCPWPIGERVYMILTDGTTLTYDLYQALSNGHEDDITVAIAPGIGNSSESVYIRTFVHFVQCHGYRCAVLNHVGALSSVKVTAPRIFSYGHTDDYHVMLHSLVEKHPNTKIICVGFSLGGNLVTKYMGERANNKLTQIIGGISICQGYDAIVGTKYLLNWQNFRRFYLYIMTESLKNIILRHRQVLLSDEVKQKHGLNEREILSAATLPELDEAYTRRIHHFRSVKEMYRWSSSINYLKDINSPMVFINAIDDPIVPEPLLDPIREYAARKQNCLYIELAHGGHLGFYEGGLLYPNPITWLDRTLVSLIGSLTLFHVDRVKVA